jgi:predicted DNA-binding protein
VSKSGAVPARSRKQVTTIRLPDELREKVKGIAEVNGTSEAAMVRRACENLVREVEAGKEIADIEARIAGTLSRSHKLASAANHYAKTNNENLQVLIAMVDQLVKFVFGTTPELVNKGAAATLFEMRYSKFWDELPHAFVQGSRVTKISAKFNLSDENSGAVQELQGTVTREKTG